MTAATIGARVAEIDAMLATVVNGPRPAASASSSSFAQALSAAQAAPATAGASGPTPYAAEIEAAAQRYGIDPALLTGLIRQESNFDASATSSAGASGLTQLMPGTAAALGVDPSDPAQAIDGGARYLKQQLDRFGGDPSKALAAYNAGPGAVAKFGGVPPYTETQGYVQKVLAYANEYRGAVSPPVSAVPAATTPVPAAAVAGSGSSLGYSAI